MSDARDPVDDAPAAEPEPGASGADADEAGEVDEVGRLSAQVADLEEKLLRARADYDNLHKRTLREAGLERDRVKARVLESFLRLHEYAKMAEFEADRSPGPLADGVKMVVREFDRLLEDEGVTRLGTVGEAFDANRHEAVAEEQAPGVAPGHVARVVQTGYLLGERVLRFAKVAVVPSGAPRAGED